MFKIGLVPFGLQKDQGAQLRKIIYPPPYIRNQKSVIGENIRKALPPPTHSKDKKTKMAQKKSIRPPHMKKREKKKKIPPQCTVPVVPICFFYG